MTQLIRPRNYNSSLLHITRFSIVNDPGRTLSSLPSILNGSFSRVFKISSDKFKQMTQFCHRLMNVCQIDQSEIGI